MRLQLLAEFKSFEQPVIARDKVRYVGEPLAVVVAESAAIGEDALDDIAVDIAPLAAVTDCATSQGETLLFEGQGTNRAMIFTAQAGDADAAFRHAPYRGRHGRAGVEEAWRRRRPWRHDRAAHRAPSAPHAGGSAAARTATH
jgi:carbon-monoxide dehydrogenase large subunit